MSYVIEYTGRFKKDAKLSIKRGNNSSIFKEVIKILENSGELPQKYKPHHLKGNYSGLWECHLQPDWLLIWEKLESEKVIKLMRTGTHSDLF